MENIFAFSFEGPEEVMTPEMPAWTHNCSELKVLPKSLGKFLLASSRHSQPVSHRLRNCK